jgi:hypothetical protein
MKARTYVLQAILVAATAAITATVVSQDKKPEPPPMTPEMQETMAKAMEFGTPGENHKLLAKKVGDWTFEGKWYFEPGSDAMPFTGKTNFASKWDDRYIVDTTDGDPMPGEPPFHGAGANGYDNIKKKFFWVWIDNMGTGVMHGEGTYDAATKTFKYTFEQPDVRTGKYVKGRSVEKWADDNHFNVEWYAPDKTGKEFKMMEFAYRRAK